MSARGRAGGCACRRCCALPAPLAPPPFPGGGSPPRPSAARWALLVGGVVSGGAYLLAQRAPGAFFTRAFIACGLMTYAALFITQSHGMIEMHFHIFGALAFLLVYRDWRITVLGAGFAAVHHLV